MFPLPSQAYKRRSAKAIMVENFLVKISIE